MQKTRAFILLLIPILFWNACNTDMSTKDITDRATSQEAHSQDFSGIDLLHNCNFTPPKDATQYRIDTAASKIEWFVENHRGFLKFSTGSFYLKDGKILSGEFIADMNTITNTDIDYALMKGTLENTLKSDDFFKTKAFPEGHFHITKIIRKTGDLYQIEGHLVLLKYSHPITFEATITLSNGKIVATSKPIIIDRTKWNVIMYSKKVAQEEDDIIVSDEIKLVVHLETIPPVTQ